MITPKLTAIAPPSASRVMRFAGIDGTDTFLNLHPGLTDTQEREIIAHLRTCGRGLPWWIGDFALHFQAKAELRAKQEAALAQKEGRKPKESADYAETLAQAWDISPGHIRNAATVASFFPVSYRNEKLTFRHHVDAMRAVGGRGKGTLDAARAWLTKALAEGWTCADLRQNALPPTTSAAPPQDPEANPYDVMDTADRWATQNMGRLRQVEPERAANLLTRFHAVVELVDHWRGLVGKKEVA